VGILIEGPQVVMEPVMFGPRMRVLMKFFVQLPQVVPERTSLWHAIGLLGWGSDCRLGRAAKGLNVDMVAAARLADAQRE
jgi:hypothetical protein